MKNDFFLLIICLLYEFVGLGVGPSGGTGSAGAQMNITTISRLSEDMEMLTKVRAVFFPMRLIGRFE